MRIDTKKMTALAMLGALAYITMFFIRLPIMAAAPFLKYDPKDVVIVIGGFLYGPLSALVLATVVSLMEMVTVSESGLIGLLMNIISSATFVCPAAWVYKRRHNLQGAVIGLSIGCLTVSAAMLLWNYWITPLYMGVPRVAVAAMLLPVFLPFNLLKGALNSAITMMLYKPVAAALAMTRLRPIRQQGAEAKHLPTAGVAAAALTVIAAIVLAIMLLDGVL